MKSLKMDILNKWLEIEYYEIANKAKFISQKIEVDDELIFDSIDCLDYLSTIEKDESKSYIITIIALLWEYSDKKKYNLKNIIIKILSRIGYPTSALIVDGKLDKSGYRFLKPTSAIDMITLALEQSSNEVIIKNRKFLLTEFQIKIWNSMNSEKVIGISAPTSAGKSFAILLKSIDKMIRNNFDIVYIVPTLSLQNQVTEDYNKMLKLLGIQNYVIKNNFEYNEDSNMCGIYIMTQEKALAAFSNEEKAFSKDMILIVDEIQNIERINEEDDLRAKILFDILVEFRDKKNVQQIIIAGPRIEEIDKFGTEIFGVKSIPINTSVSPVLSLTYSIKKINKKYIFRQYCALSDSIYEREIRNSQLIEGYGKKRYLESYMDYLKKFVNNIGENDQNIIFVPTTDTARKVAAYFAKDCKCKKLDNKLQSLISYYENTVNKNYALCKVLKGGIAYHHGKLPVHVRRTLEKAISDKIISNVICTTTLMQGVNMPAQNVIIRNPHLYINKKVNSNELSNYEMANLRGRSGRLLKDFIGRTYILDESGFENVDGYEQTGIFEEATAELPSGYGEKFEQYKDDIINFAESTKAVDEEIDQYGYLVSYIRQSVLRYGENSKEKLEKVGINLTHRQIKNIISRIELLEVPNDICYKNRYWDPFVLNEIYLNYDGQLPNRPDERGAKTRVDELMRFLRDNNVTSSMYKKNIPEEYREKGNRTLLRNYCINWACENPLSTILVGERYEGEDGSENIDETIELLEKTVAFKIPLLLKPLFDMFKPESIFLTCIQTGACNRITRKMIEIGVPRETAIYIKNKLFSETNVDNKDEKIVEEIIRKNIQDKFDELPYWIKVQLKFMM